MSLPLLDEHSATFAASQSAVWQAVSRYARSMAHSDHAVLGRLLGTEPESGFELAEEVEHEHLVLTGRHRFARYRLVFKLDGESSNSTKLSVLSFAEFPGARGRLYRRLLMGTRGHELAIRRMLHTIGREVAKR